MGSKISFARLNFGDRLTALECEEKPQSELFCFSAGCAAKLSFVSRHNRRCTHSTIEVSPCFRLKKNELHDINCKYNLLGQLKIIVASSKSEVLSSISNGQYEFQLHILLKALRVLPDSAVIDIGESWAAEGEKNKGFSNKGSLSNYLKTLSQILELRSLCENNDDLKKIIVLKFKQDKIPWGKFYFDLDNLSKFVSFYKDNYSTVPLAISGRIYAIKPPTDTFKHYVVELYAPYILPDKNGITRRVVPQIIIKNNSLLKHMNYNDEYIFFGRWNININDRRLVVNKIIYENIRMNVENEEHYIVF
ncbi:MAG: hypothetical protein NT086_07670 [Proteobacteria bacterium]|nr:hypothetical protein [Pseudomonadota bacterium]